MIREGRITYLILGKRRVIDVRDLDAWIEQQKRLIPERGVNVAA